MNTERLTHRTISLALAAVLTASMLIGIDSLAAQQHAGNELMAQTPNATAPRS